MGRPEWYPSTVYKMKKASVSTWVEQMSGTPQQVPARLPCCRPFYPSSAAYKQAIPGEMIRIIPGCHFSTHDDFIWIIEVSSKIAGAFNIQYKKYFKRLFNTRTFEWNWWWRHLRRAYIIWIAHLQELWYRGHNLFSRTLTECPEEKVADRGERGGFLTRLFKKALRLYETVV